MRRLLLLAGALLVPVLPLLSAAPAEAADNVICVDMPAGTTCNATPASIPAAIALANGNALADTILVGPGVYTDGPYQLNGVAHGLTLRGSGQGTTIMRLPDSASSQTTVAASRATVQDLTIALQPGANSDNDRGITLSDSSVAERVTVDGAGTLNARGLNSINSVVKNASVLMPVSDSNSRAVYSDGGTTITDTVLSGAQGFVHSGGTTTDTVSRLTIRASYAGVLLDGGTINVDDSVIDLGTSSGTGVLGDNPNNGTAGILVDANHLTIVGGGAGSKGVVARATATGAAQNASVTVANSIIRGPEVSLVAEAGNGLGMGGGTSTAVLTVAYTDYHNASPFFTTNGTGCVCLSVGNVVDVDPGFVNAAAGNYRLSPGSPVVDQGNPPADGGRPTDRDGNLRVVDGDSVPGAIRDLGAYELQDTTAPDTTITSGPTGLTNDLTPTFAFTSEAGAAFECKLDTAAYSACQTPFTTPTLGDGAHSVAVRAKDAYGNVDATPATRTFTVDTTAPDTTVTTKVAKRVTKEKVKIVFSSEAGATFECQVDGKAWKVCTSPVKLKVKQGKHTVLIRATDAAGNTDATPAKVKFKRVPRPR